MPSPFPGMDPFLEEPNRWPDLHSRLNNAISELIARQVVPNFTVHIEERVHIASPEEIRRQIIAPDAYLVQREAHAAGRGSTATISPPALVEPIYAPEIHNRYIEVLDALSQEVVATLEVLSPANKMSGTTGREHFLRKRQAILSSSTHWIEIDLLRAGERPPEVAGRSDYCSLLARGDRTGPFEVWYTDLRDRLPTIAVPLRPPYDDVPLDLQAALDMAYARAFYDESLNYHRSVPLPRLSPADANWVASRVREWQQARAGASGTE